MEAFLAIRYLFIYFLTTLLLSTSSYSSSKIYSSDLEKTFPKIKLKITQREKRIVANIKELYALSNKGIINRRLFIKLYKDMTYSKTFRAYRFWPKDMAKLTKVSKSIYSLKKFCSIEKQKKFKDYIQEELNSKTVDNCFRLYLSRLSKNHFKDFKFHKIERNFISKYKNELFNHKYLDELENLLNSFKAGSKKHQLYSDLISNFYITQNTTPPKDLIKYLYIRPSLTRFLQGHDIDKFSTQYVFYAELRKLKQKAFDILDEKKPRAEISEAFQKTYDYFNLTFAQQPQDKALLTLESISKSLMRRGYYELAQVGFKRILKEKSHHFSSSLFNHIWTFILQKEYGKAIAALKQNGIDNKFLQENSKIKFWIAHAYKEDGNSKMAQTLQREIIKKDPLSFYAILSAKVLSEESKATSEDIYLSKLDGHDKLEKISSRVINKPWLKRLSLWTHFYLPQFISLEMKNADHFKKETIQNNILTAAYMLSKKDQYLESFKIIYKAMNSNNIKLTKNTIHILFPRPYLKQITRNTRDFDPVIALSLIRQESGFNNKARSHVGARGLMQLMPATAKRFKSRLRTKHLYNPRLNIQIGTTYFNKLLDRYNQNLVYSLAAYNAGEHRVDRWQGDYLNSESILENIENIPYNETRKYVKLIFRNIFFYKLIFDKTLDDSNELNKIFDVELGFNG